ncbi:hypothetical protein RRG08_036100 [Elysia crispata]|uniref:Uncharacterized protein n=1 Tax=Elysia crispata TaxID=231223 RepID=A0AAE1AN76_9GAST|nr:hypothetical protein RRG08_036100 [Elysia crispata]
MDGGRADTPKLNIDDTVNILGDFGKATNASWPIRWSYAGDTRRPLSLTPQPTDVPCPMGALQYGQEEHRDQFSLPD